MSKDFNKRIVIRPRLGVGTGKQILHYIPNGSFNLTWEKNTTNSLSLSMNNDNSTGYNLLDVENIITFDGQDYVIKQVDTNFQDNLESKSITATHISNEMVNIYQNSIKKGTLTYGVEDVLSFVFDGNDQGFTFEVLGSFEKAQITDFGNCNGKDAVSKILTTWPNSVLYVDNKHITIYEQSNFTKFYGKRVDYLHNAKNVQLSYLSTNIVNKLQGVGAKKEDGSNYFDMVTVTDERSIQDYGLHQGQLVSDDRFKDATSMTNYLTSLLKPQPTLTISADVMLDDKPIVGELKRLEIKTTGFVTFVEVVGYVHYPLDHNFTNITLNNTAKTIFDYQIKNRDRLSRVAQDALNDLKNKLAKLDGRIKTLEQPVKPDVPVVPDVRPDIKPEPPKPQPPQPKPKPQPIPISYNKKIIDVSEFQGDIDWNKAISDNLGCAVIRIQDGTDHRDTKKTANLKAVSNSNINYGVYAFFRGQSIDDAQNEAQNFYNRVQYSSGLGKQPNFWMIDVETIEMSNNVNAMRQGVEAYMDKLNELGIPDSKIVLYISNNLYNQFNLNVQRAGGIWLPSYGTNDGTIQPNYKPSHPFDLWQYTSQGHIAGISTNVDMSTDPSERFIKNFLLSSDIPKPPEPKPIEPPKPKPVQPTTFDVTINHNLGYSPTITAKYYEYAIGTEPNGLGTGPNGFGETNKTDVHITSQVNNQTATISLPIKYKTTVAPKLGSDGNWYIIDGYKTIKLTIN